MSWVLHRVDDRLIHGQVVIAWGQRLRPRRTWVADDASALSAWERELWLCRAGSRGAGGERERGVPPRTRPAAAEGGAFLIVRDLGTALALVEAGAEITAFNVGGLHYAPGKSKVHEYVYLDEADRTAARALIGRGVALEVQDVPASRAQPLAGLDPSLVTPPAGR
jgi:PTS system mannose-specific IIB component/fructoselysine and glucoselysine-specific PTS system IIB component